MQLLSPIVGLLVLGLLVTATKADISLKLRNKSYLPPPIEDVPIKETFFNAQENSQQQSFQEAKYANSRYQIFEVHNHYEPSASNDVNEPKSSVNNDYLPPQEEEIHIQHINAPADFPLDDPNLDASYLSFASGSDSNNQQIIVKHETRIASANNKLSNNFQSKHIQSNNLQSHNVPVPFPSNYQHNFPKKSSSTVEYVTPKQNIHSSRKPGKPSQKIQGHPQQQQQVVSNFNTQLQTQQFSQQHLQNSFADGQHHHTTQQAIPKSNTIKTKEYLPPIETKPIVGKMPAPNIIQNPFKGPDYLPPHTGNDGKSSYKARGYLLPHQSGSAKQNTGFKGPEISALHQQGVTQSKQPSFQQNTGFKSPEISASHRQTITQQQQKLSQLNSAFKGPDYLPPHQHNSAQQKQTSYQQNSLPSHQNVPSQEKQSSFQQNSPFKGPDRSVKQQPSFFQQNSKYKGPDYLPPYKDGSSLPQQTSFQPNPPFRGPDYLPPYTNQIPQQQTQYKENNPNFKASAYLPPGYDFQKPDNSEQAIAELHTLPEQSQQYQQEVTVGTQIQVAEREESPDIIYGTPKQANLQQSGGLYEAPGYLPPAYVAPMLENFKQTINEFHSQGPQQQHTHQEYIPAGYDFQKPENSEQAIQQLHGQESSKPRQNQILTPFKANEYLPPSYVAPQPENSDQAISQLHSLNGDEQQTSHSASEDIGGQSNNISGYLPPDYEFQKPAEAKQYVNQNYQTQTQQSAYYSPRNSQKIQSFNQASQQIYTQAPVSQQSQTQISQPQSFQTQGSKLQTYSQSLQEVQQIADSFKGSNYLPPVINAPQSDALNYKVSDYLSPVTSSQSILQQITQPSVIPFKGPNYLPPVSSSPMSQAQQQSQFKAPDYLPPVGSSEPQLQQITQPSVQPFKGPDYLPPHTSSIVNYQALQQLEFKAPDYLPPVTSSQPQLQQITQPSVQPFKGPDYLPPQNPPQMSISVNYKASQQGPQFKAPDYLPPTQETPSQPIQSTIMYPLSRYMTTVQPHERYGNARKPFPEYGPPPTTAAPIFTNSDLSPMYREPATRPQYYAPTMSYTNNAINTQTYTTYTQNHDQQSSSALNQQIRQTLQTFMPKDTRQEIPHNHNTATYMLGAKTALQTIRPTTAKIRTVQIVNNTNVKTLKVLESLDHAGVKTIKILGHSNEQPMGDHRVIKVVSGQGKIEQTVKIFNDQQDANTAVDQSSQINSNNGYLPPRRKRNSKKSSSM